MKHHSLSLLSTLALLLTAPSWGQQAPGGAAAGKPAAAPREAPRPDQLEPGVDTSAPPNDSSSNAAGAQSAAIRDTAPRTLREKRKAAAPTGAAPSPNANTAATQGAAEASAGPATSTGARGSAQAKLGAGRAQDRIELDTTQITGNRELPKVLYIVPWKRSDLGDLVGRPTNSLLDEVLSPVDRDVFKRENRYYEALKPDAGTAAPAAGTGAPPVGGGKP